MGDDRREIHLEGSIEDLVIEGKRRQVEAIISDTIEDLVSDLLYYGRKEDEELPMGALQSAVRDGRVDEAWIVGTFARVLHRGLTEGR